MFWFFHTQSLKLTSKLTAVFIDETTQNLGQGHQRPVAVAEKSQSHPSTDIWSTPLGQTSYAQELSRLSCNFYSKGIFK